MYIMARRRILSYCSKDFSAKLRSELTRKMFSKMFKYERDAANASTDEGKKGWEQDAKITKGKLQTFKMNEAFFESLPQVSKMCI